MGKCLSKNSDTTEQPYLSTEEEPETSISNAQSQLTVNYEILLGLIKNDSQILKLRSDHYVSEVLNAAVKKICNEKDEIANTYFLCLKYFEQVFICDNDSNYITPEKRKERIRRARENVGCLKSDFLKLREALGDAEGRLENVRDGEARTSALNQIQEMRTTLFELIVCTAKMQSQMMKERFERNEENEKIMRHLMLNLSSKSRRPELANILQILSGFSGDLLNADLSWSGDDQLFVSLRQNAKGLVDSLHTLFSTIQAKIDRYQRYTEPANCGKKDKNEKTFASFYDEIRGSIRELSEIMLKFNVGESPAFDDSLSERPTLTWTGTSSTSRIVVPMESTETET